MNKNVEEQHLEIENPRQIEGLTTGLLAVVLETQQRLKDTSKRPLVIIIYGLAGAGKSTSAEMLQSTFSQMGMKAIYIERDDYGEGEVGKDVMYSNEDFTKQQMAWRKGENFEIYDRTHVNEKGEKKPQKREQPAGQTDVVIVDGIYDPEQEIIEPDGLEVYMEVPFMTRLARKCLRDHIANGDGQEWTLDSFMDQLVAPDSSDGDLLVHLLEQEKEGAVARAKSEIIIMNNELKNDPKIWLEGNVIHFFAQYQNNEYKAERTLTPERIALIKSIIQIDKIEEPKV